MSSGGSNSAVNSVRIKKELLQSNGIDNVVRLSSFTLPRDLTLGGAGPIRGRGNANKKVYTPNLNVVRNKNINVKTPKDASARGRGRPERGKSDRGGARGGRGGKNNLIQTTGIFSEGAGSEHIKRASSSYRSSWNDRDEGASAMQKPTIIKNEGKIDMAAEEQNIKDILGEIMELEFDEKKTDPIDLENIPVKLNEGELEDKINSVKLKKRSEPQHFRYPISAENFFDRAQPQLFLLQLPDSLPRQDETIDKDTPGTSKESEANDKSEAQVLNTSSLRDLEEGQIGKLIRYKSGKQKLILGNTRFDIDLGMDTGFLQEVMSVSSNREERSGNMINLGPINAKLTAIPDWESLFKDTS